MAPAKTGPLLLTAATGAGSDQAAAAGAGRTVSWRNVIVSHVRSVRLFLYSENYCSTRRVHAATATSAVYVQAAAAGAGGIVMCSCFQVSQIAVLEVLVEVVARPMPTLPSSWNKIVGLCKALRREVDPVATPHTAQALASLEAALDEEYVLPQESRTRMKSTLESKRKQIWYQRKRRQKAEAQLRAFKKTRVDRILSLEWTARIGLAPPQLPAPSIKLTLTEAMPAGSAIGTTSVHRIRDAFCEFWKVLADEALVVFVRRGLHNAPHTASRGAAAAGAARSQFPAAAAAIGAGPACTAILLHVHDEAALRLRSQQVGCGQSRSRCSKVQQHVCTLHLRDSVTEIPTELEALADKTSAALATSLDGVLRKVAPYWGREIERDREGERTTSEGEGSGTCGGAGERGRNMYIGWTKCIGKKQRWWVGERREPPPHHLSSGGRAVELRAQ